MDQERLEKQLKEEKKVIEEKVKAKLSEEQSEQFQALQKELNEKSEQIKELNRTKAEIEKLKREKSELKEAVEAEAQKKLNEVLVTEKDKIRKSEEEKNELKFKADMREKQIEKVITNTIDMYGSIKGIAGNAIQSVKALELPAADDVDEGSEP